MIQVNKLINNMGIVDRESFYFVSHNLRTWGSSNEVESKEIPDKKTRNILQPCSSLSQDVAMAATWNNSERELEDTTICDYKSLLTHIVKI